MSNWCSNTFEVTGNSQRMQSFYEFLEERGGKDWFDFFVEPAKEDDENWYNHNLENYGCKWNCEAGSWSIQDLDDDRSKIELHFESPWGPPTKLYETLAEDESLEIYAEYNEEGMGFVGRFADGEDEYYEYDGLDSLDEIPEELVGNWAIRESLESWEEMEQEEIDIDELQKEFDEMKGEDDDKKD
jgi:hypothetical protein